jgi:hypothetical protein
MNFYIYFGLFFSGLSVLSDHLLLWHPLFNPFQNDFLFLRDFSHLRILVGVWGGIITIFGQVLCFFKVMDIFYPDSCLKKINFITLILLLSLGVSYHFSLGLLASLVKSEYNITLLISQFIKPLEIAIGIVFLALNYFWLQLNKSLNNQTSKRLRFALPIFVYLIGVIFSLFRFEIGKMILLSGFNLCLGLIFILMLNRDISSRQ